jgi:hypothetical protein
MVPRYLAAELHPDEHPVRFCMQSVGSGPRYQVRPPES